MHRKKHPNKRRKRRQRRLWIFAGSVILIIYFFCTVLYISGSSNRHQLSSPTVSDDIVSCKTDTGTTPVSSIVPDNHNTSSEDKWNLILVNPWNPLPADYSVTITHLKNRQAIDSRCYSDLQDMMDACRAEGLSPLICSSYRSWEKQETLYNDQVNALIAQGYFREDARSEAATMVAVPGTSEHQLGLAVDIVDKNYQILETAQENTEVQKWMLEHCWEYGFILRYPKDKSDITGIIYEPWHYRYVGREAAKEITEAGICLEEYLAQ